MKALKLSSFISSLLLLASCSVFDSHVDVDYIGYEVKTDIIWDYEHMAYTLRLSLAYGEDGSYRFNYLFDSDAAIYLMSDGNMNFTSGNEIQLSKTSGRSYIIPSLSQGAKHSIHLAFEYDGITKEYDVALPDTNQNAIGIRVDTSKNEFTEVILTNPMGASASKYTVTFYLDGQPLDDIKYMSNTFDGSMELNFSERESYVFQMPYLIPGEHILKVDVRSSQNSETISVSFTEPQRRSTELVFSYNPYTGNIMIQSPYNPVNTSFSVTIDMTLDGKVSFHHPQFFGIADLQVDYPCYKGESSVGSITPTLVEQVVDGGKLKSLLDQMAADTREDAQNAIGNGNQRTIHAETTYITLRFTIHSLGEYAGRTSVKISPSSYIPVTYTYSGWTDDYGYDGTSTVYAEFIVNGSSAGIIRTL